MLTEHKKTIARLVEGEKERGREQARALAQRLTDEPLDAIFASDLARAHETALIVAEIKRMSVTTDRGLRCVRR